MLASSEGVAPRNDNTLKIHKLKHPSSPADLALPDKPGEDVALPAVAGEEDIGKALSSFRPGSAGGPDGLRPGHLLASVSRKAAEADVRLMSSLTEFVNLLMRREVPEFAKSIIYGANLSGMEKKDNGVRPFAEGSSFRRLAMKVGEKNPCQLKSESFCAQYNWDSLLEGNAKQLLVLPTST